MKRGEVWTVRAAGFATKPRPAVIVQSDSVVGFESTVICLFTSAERVDSKMRIPVSPSKTNGLSKRCFVMAEKPVAVKVSALGEQIGVLEDEVMQKLDVALAEVLGLG